MDIVRNEGFLRLLAIVLLVLTAFLVGFDSQTKLLFDIIERKATYKDMNALFVLVWIDAAVAGYNALQLLRCFLLPTDLKGETSYKNCWLFFFLDQGVAYTVFAATSAALEASTIAVTGVKSLQWMKICNRYTRFCYQIGGALLCGYLAFLLLALVSSLSAFQLFRLYSPNHFLQHKSK